MRRVLGSSRGRGRPGLQQGHPRLQGPTGWCTPAPPAAASPAHAASPRAMLPRCSRGWWRAGGSGSHSHGSQPCGGDASHLGRHPSPQLP